MRRRAFFGTVLATPIGLVYAQQPDRPNPMGFRVGAGTDRFGSPIQLPGTNSPLWVKVTNQDTGGQFFLTQQTYSKRGGPGRHVHFDQDEWWYCLAGEYVVEVGGTRYAFKESDSVFGPRRVPHTFALVSNTPGEILVGFTPAGRMEELFRELAKRGRNFDNNDRQERDRLRYFGLESRRSSGPCRPRASRS